MAAHLPPLVAGTPTVRADAQTTSPAAMTALVRCCFGIWCHQLEAFASPSIRQANRSLRRTAIRAALPGLACARACQSTVGWACAVCGILRQSPRAEAVRISASPAHPRARILGTARVLPSLPARSRGPGSNGQNNQVAMAQAQAPPPPAVEQVLVAFADALWPSQAPLPGSKSGTPSADTDYWRLSGSAQKGVPGKVRVLGPCAARAARSTVPHDARCMGPDCVRASTPKKP